MTCGRVRLWKKRPTFEELMVISKCCIARGAKRANWKAVYKLTELLVIGGSLHAVRLKLKSKTKWKRKSPLQLRILGYK